MPVLFDIQRLNHHSHQVSANLYGRMSRALKKVPRLAPPAFQPVQWMVLT
jgi:hypothetical protein